MDRAIVPLNGDVASSRQPLQSSRIAPALTVPTASSATDVPLFADHILQTCHAPGRRLLFQVQETPKK
jgi:hypothetical protein